MGKSFPFTAQRSSVASTYSCNASSTKPLRCAVNGKDFPTPSQLKVDASTYVMGMSDLIGEFRRIALNRMIEGKVEEAAEWVNEMERLFVAISRLHYPSKLVQIRKKQDTARAMLDRTRGELATTMASHSLRK